VTNRVRLRGHSARERRPCLVTGSGKNVIARRIADDRAGRFHEHCGWKKIRPARRANAPYKFRAWISSEPRAHCGSWAGVAILKRNTEIVKSVRFHQCLNGFIIVVHRFFRVRRAEFFPMISVTKQLFVVNGEKDQTVPRFIRRLPGI
jgi:hypothetical protein